MQQMYMYYYGMYGGFNPMLNPQYPGMNNYMNPYSNYSQSNSNKNPPQPGVPNLPMPPINSMGPMNPLSMGINPMTGMPGGYNPMGAPGMGAPGMGAPGMGSMMGMPNLGPGMKNSLLPTPQMPKQNKLPD